MSSDSESQSQHPTDILIRHLIATGGPATEAEVQVVIDRMAAAPFSRDVYRVPRALRIEYLGQTLGARADSLSIHLVKRVVEGQWATGTTTADYLSDIRATVQAPSARILVTEADWGGSFAAAITPTTDVVPAGRRGPGAQRLLFVLYSANDAILKTAYMFSDLTTLRLSGKTVWLR